MVEDHRSPPTSCGNLLQSLLVKFLGSLNMAKSASPIRLQQDIMRAAEATGRRFHRSTAEQIEGRALGVASLIYDIC